MLQVVLTGLSNGAIYGIVGMAYALVYYVTRVINLRGIHVTATK